MRTKKGKRVGRKKRLSLRGLHICSAVVLATVWIATAQPDQPDYLVCPDGCECTIADRVSRVFCGRGGMMYLPMDLLDKYAQSILIIAPIENPNYLTLGPLFTQPEPFQYLRELRIVNCNIPSIGQYSFWGLKNLQYIDLSHNNISTIGMDNFRGLLNLLSLHLDFNIIDVMPSETFRHLTALKTLTLSYNRITALAPRLFRMLAKLASLDLSNNPLIELSPEVFKDIQHLRFLKCRACMLRRINTQIYHLISNLEELDIGDNLFKYLNSDEFISLKKLRVLKLDGNQLAVVVDYTFGSQRELRALSLARNRLAMLAPAAFTNLTSLMYLDISYNKLDRFHLQTFSPIVNSLRTINFSGNNLLLNDIAIVLQILPELNGLILANLSIEELPANFFAHNRHLVNIDISCNKLATFPYPAITRARFVQRLNISANKIEKLDEATLERLEAIAHIDLRHNPWRCDYCSAVAALTFMESTVLNSSLRLLKCRSPPKLRGVLFGELTESQLDPCDTAYETQLSVIAGLMLLCVAVLAAIAAVLCCNRRRAARYYTNEEKRYERDHEPNEQPNELLPCTELGTVATIHAPYHYVAKGS